MHKDRVCDGWPDCFESHVDETDCTYDNKLVIYRILLANLFGNTDTFSSLLQRNVRKIHINRVSL